MADFLRLLEVACGHSNKALFVIRGADFCFTVDLSIIAFEFIVSEQDLRIQTDTGDFGSLWFHHVHSAEPGGHFGDSADYRFYFDGGEVEVTINLS